MEVGMNKEFILQLIEPYLNSKRELSEFEFMEIFATGDYPLNRKEQYEVINIMIEYDIEYVDEKDEEIELVKSAELLNFNTINQDTEHLQKLKNEQLAIMTQNGDEAALATIIEKNMRFIYQLAIKIQNKYTKCCLTVDDLAQEGAMGIIVAVHKFDPNKEYVLLTYAWSWIRQFMERAILNTGFPIRLPVHVFEKVIRIGRYRRMNPNANLDEIAIMLADDSNNYTLQEIQQLVKYSEMYLNVVSLNVLVGDNEDSELQDFLVGDGHIKFGR